MEFGKLADISQVNWELPLDDVRNKINPSPHLKIYMGAPTWGNKQWRGKFYPMGAQEETFLYLYSRQFNCTELNTSFYRIPSPEIAKEWRTHVPESFRFCPKIYKGISHSQFGLGDRGLLNEWFIFLRNLENKLGPCLLQFHEKFSYNEKLILFQFLEKWPSEIELTLEFRHPSWFKDHSILPALTDYLRKRRIGLVINDVAGRRDVLHTSITAPWTMLRLIGNNLGPSDELRLKLWAERLKSWQENGIEAVYLMLHQPDDIWTIEFARLALNVLQEKNLKDIPHFEPLVQRDLFSHE